MKKLIFIIILILSSGCAGRSRMTINGTNLGRVRGVNLQLYDADGFCTKSKRSVVDCQISGILKVPPISPRDQINPSTRAAR